MFAGAEVVLLVMKTGLLKDEFLRHSLIVFQAAGLISLSSLVYHVFMIRVLTVTEYAALNALTAMYLLIIQPVECFEIVITKFTSAYSSSRDHAGFKRFIFYISKKIVILSGTLFLVLFIFSQRIGHFLNIESRALIMLLGAVVFFSFFSGIISGILKGYQRFGFFSLYELVAPFLKLGFGVLLVMLGCGILGAMSGWAAAQLLAPCAGVFLLSRLFFDKRVLSLKGIKASLKDTGNHASGGEFLRIYKYFMLVACHSILFIALTNIDLILVKHFFHSESAGFYSIAQMVGKIVLFLPMAIPVVMFSKTSQAHAMGGQGLDVFKKSLFYVALLCGAVIFMCVLFPGEIIKLISGRDYPQCVPLAKLFAVSMGFFSLSLVVFNYNLSMHRFSYLFFMFFFLLLETGAIILFHSSLVQVLTVLTAVSVLLFLISLLSGVSGIISQRQKEGL